MPTYVQHEVLARIPDVFNAESIWQAPGLALFSRRPLLRDLLERSPREQRGNAATRCFSHITLRLPQDDLDDDYHLTRGTRARELAQSLALLHQKDFGDLLGNDEVRYDITGGDDLAPGEIEVRFGHAIYLPAPGERALFNVAASRDGAVWKPVCPVYPGQRLALLGGAAGFVTPGWPFGDDGAVLLINDGPDTEPVLQVRPKEAFLCTFDASLGAYAISAKPAGGPRLLLKVIRAGQPARPVPSARPAAGAPAVLPAAAPAARAAVWQPRASDADAGAGADAPTAVPIMPRSATSAHAGESDATFAPGAMQRLSVVALAVPRLSRYRSTGAMALDIPFAADLAVARAADADRAITFSVDVADELHAITSAGRQRVHLPATIEAAPGRSIVLSAPPGEMAERYSAIVTLPQTASAALAPGIRSTFGRGQAAARQLRLLDATWMLQAAPGSTEASPDRIGLSRTAFAFEPGPRGLAVTRLSATQALYHLDPQMQPVAAIGPLAEGQPYLVPPGHHLVAGHYVLRFDA